MSFATEQKLANKTLFMDVTPFLLCRWNQMTSLSQKMDIFESVHLSLERYFDTQYHEELFIKREALQCA